MKNCVERKKRVSSREHRTREKPQKDQEETNEYGGKEEEKQWAVFALRQCRECSIARRGRTKELDLDIYPLEGARVQVVLGSST